MAPDRFISFLHHLPWSGRHAASVWTRRSRRRIQWKVASAWLRALRALHPRILPPWQPAFSATAQLLDLLVVEELGRGSSGIIRGRSSKLLVDKSHCSNTVIGG